MLVQEIKSLLSEKVLKQIVDKSTQNIIRGIIFNSDNKIDWDDAIYYSVYKNMPELLKEENNNIDYLDIKNRQKKTIYPGKWQGHSKRPFLFAQTWNKTLLLY